MDLTDLGLAVSVTWSSVEMLKGAVQGFVKMNKRTVIEKQRRN